MKNEKTREEIVAEREAKKKAKMMAKKKLNSTADNAKTGDSVGSETTAKNTQPQLAQATASLPTAKNTQPKQGQATAFEPTAKNTQPQPAQATASLPTAKNTPPKQGQATASLTSTKSKKNEGRKKKKSESSSDGQSSKVDSKALLSNLMNGPIPKSPTNPDKPVTQSQATVTFAKEIKNMPTENKEHIKEKDLNDAKLGGEDSGKTSNLSKAELKAARRLKQEMQRAAKAGQSTVKTQKSAVESQPPREAQDKASDKKVSSKAVVKDVELKKNTLKAKASISLHKVKLFNHLYNDDELSIKESFSHLHPAIIGLGVQYASRVIVGSNARCYSLMNALKQVIEDYITPQQKEFARGLESCLKPCMAFLHRCRPLSVSMTNAMKHLKWQMTQLPNDVSDVEAKKKLQEAIDTYLRDQIEVAAQAICITVQRKISDGDVILTYGCSSLVQRILFEAHDNGTKFRVVIVDARPKCEGLQLLHRLVQHGIRCSYVLIGAASCMMREATKVLLGTHALLANGYVMSRAGSSQVALLAHSYNVPVLVCCETHKFCERVQTDALVHNELGDPDALMPCRGAEDIKPLTNWRSVASLTPLNLTYDVTPPDLVTAVVTELAILPCTSVPVILRVKPTDSHH